MPAQITALSATPSSARSRSSTPTRPGDTAAACTCVATMLRHWYAEQQREAQGEA
ncbi:hypothetical protein AB2M62_18060 [Sphingomonas sp. MMS12-HWE2-04]|uniref:hypothetical protein n=1 Tax=Sphingomonas sp. MMS12-HWE2-04 TaxID=3234199 RepID=UPI00384F5930